MADVIPFKCCRPIVKLAEAVAAAPYDTFSRAEAAQEIARHPHSFLRIDKPAALLPSSVDEYAPEVYAKAQELLNADFAAGLFVSDFAENNESDVIPATSQSGGLPQATKLRESSTNATVPDNACYYIYRLTQGQHRQTGIVACVAVSDYQSQVIKRHENTRDHKQQDRVDHINALDAHTGPVLLTYKASTSIDAIIQQITQDAAPLFDFVAPDAVRHQVWRLANALLTAQLQAAFAAVDALYIADGHHRAAAAVTVAEQRQRQSEKNNPGEKSGQADQTAQAVQASQVAQTAQSDQASQVAQTAQAAQTSHTVQTSQSGQAAQVDQTAQAAQVAQVAQTAQSDQTRPSPEYQHFLAAIFPDNQMQVLDYNRVIQGLAGHSAAELLELTAEIFDVSKVGSQPYRPQQRGQIGMYLDGSWYKLEVKPGQRSNDPVDGMDISILHSALLAPVLQITDPRSNPNIAYVGGARGLEELKTRADASQGVAFSLYPCSLAELFAVADAGRLMPPKSTWFEPKPRSGLFIHRL